MAMGDASVHFVAYDVDLRIFRSLGTRVAVTTGPRADVPVSPGDL
jgi:hypothetical protein